MAQSDKIGRINDSVVKAHVVIFRDQSQSLVRQEINLY